MGNKINWAKLIPKLKVKENEPLFSHTTFKIGGPCETMVFPKNVKELKKVVNICEKFNGNWLVLGAGSNLLFSDNGFRGTIISLENFGFKPKLKTNSLIIGAGLRFSSVLKMAVSASLSGLEWGVMIPATIGGMVVMNASAFGGKMADVVSCVWAFNGKKIIKLKNKDCQFNYRTSVIKNKNWIVLAVKLKLNKVPKQQILNQLLVNINKRKSSQPQGFSAGSVFKKSSKGPAGLLIDAAGLKNESVGDAVVSEIHANFIINKNKAKCEDVLKLMEKISKIVYNKYNVNLEPEIIIKGENNEDCWRLSHP